MESKINKIKETNKQMPLNDNNNNLDFYISKMCTEKQESPFQKILDSEIEKIKDDR